jgi:glycosyltransferase involved in cell wall biosynthesis
MQVAGDCSHEFVVLSDSAAVTGLVRSLQPPSNVEVQRAYEWLPLRLRLAIEVSLPLLRLLRVQISSIERTARRAGVKLAWFLPGGPHEVLDVPYIATVWDLMHRSHPWFPEVSAHGIWEGREGMLRRFLQRASFVIVGTDAGREELRNYYQIPDARIHKLPHPTPAFALEAPTGGEDERIQSFALQRGYLLYPAQFWPHKNHANLLLALKVLKDEHALRPNLVLVGSEKGNFSHVRSLAHAYGVDSQVRFLGFVSQSDLVALYRRALALIYPSFCGPENLPPLEAFALGCPVIAADIAGAREQLGDGALLVDPRSAESIAEAIKSLLEDEKLRHHLAARGMRRAADWTPAKFVRGVLTIFDAFEPVRRCW